LSRLAGQCARLQTGRLNKARGAVRWFPVQGSRFVPLLNRKTGASLLVIPAPAGIERVMGGGRMGWPAYLDLQRTGELADRASAARRLLETCRLCPRGCGARRLEGEPGACGVAGAAVVSSAGPHFGEERPLVGGGGSGTIFFTGCNLRCVFCQNHDISQGGAGRATASDELAGIMLAMQRMGCHNINLVTPTHVVPQFLAALVLAAARGLAIPVVYNCGGYESVETLTLLDGVIDIYMPDVKYADAAIARRYSAVEAYPEVAMAAVREMHRQVGDLATDQHGIARRGLLVRHLVLPDGMAGTASVMGFLAGLSRETYVNVMDQYRPCHLASRYPGLARRVTRQEVAEALAAARAAGLHRLDGQG
jgi:putative pyruvate formate lyase activating enzyme